MFLLVIISYVIVMWFEISLLSKEIKSGKIMLYLFLMIFSMIISVLLTLGVQLPSPSNVIKNIVVVLFGKNN